ncbi:hypothetical protein AFCA_011243 [Aspergillus flavus]|nr:hypothetical protein AFCA_011243 [Aspergillus flavus]
MPQSRRPDRGPRTQSGHDMRGTNPSVEDPSQTAPPDTPHPPPPPPPPRVDEPLQAASPAAQVGTDSRTPEQQDFDTLFGESNAWMGFDGSGDSELSDAVSLEDMGAKPGRQRVRPRIQGT